MIPIFNSLEQISTGYSVFEKDQVLTHEQLNSLADYADDQIRLTRVKLLGIGLACGLRVTYAAGASGITVSGGVGVTTDGDLLYLNRSTTYTQFRPYDASYPAYAPFYLNGDVNGTMFPAFELLTADVVDSRAQPLGQFAANAPAAANAGSLSLDLMTAVLLMESYRKDDDLCSGDDCDNLGIEALNTIKLVILESRNVSAFLENIVTAGGAFTLLPAVVAERPLVTTGISTPTLLAGLYRATCTNIHNALVPALSSIFPTCLSFISDIFPVDPFGTWIGRLNQIRGMFAADANIQYYYDFLKDVAETYNEFRDLVFGDTTLCSPDTARFPKHLLLGNLVAGVDPDANRTGFYPSPVTSHAASDVDHAKFLLRKLDVLIRGFEINAQLTPDVRITPSSFEDTQLEKRAIPFYYPPHADNEIPKYWSYRLARRKTEKTNYSYHAPLYGAQGGAANPFRSQMGRFTFFRIEGHVGKPVASVISSINAMIKANNLPFAVQAVVGGTDRTKITIKPPIRYTDLHRLHYVLRQDLVTQLDDVRNFSTAFKAKVDAEPSTVGAELEECNCPSPRTLAAATNTTVANTATALQAKLNRSYTSYIADPSWTDGMKNTLNTVSQFKSNLGAVAKTDFTTPFDTLIGSSQVCWLPGLDTVIKKKNDQEDDKLLLTNFIDRNPMLEHFAGVVRGGTFILVYDASTTNVVADFMVPYYCCDQTDTVVDEPALPRPDIKTTYLVENGVKVLPSRSTLIDAKINTFSAGYTAQLNQTLDTRLTFQSDYMGLFRDSINMLGSTVPRVDQLAAAKMGPPAFADEYLGMKVDECTMLAEKIDVAHRKADTMDNDTLRDRYNTESIKAQSELNGAIRDVMQYLSENGIDVADGTEGARAVDDITPGLAFITDRDTVDAFVSGMTDIANNATDPNIQTICNNMIDTVRG